jgi:hypothetical protein
MHTLLRQGGVLAFVSFVSFFVSVACKAFGNPAGMKYEVESFLTIKHVVINDLSVKPESICQVQDGLSDCGIRHTQAS